MIRESRPDISLDRRPIRANKPWTRRIEDGEWEELEKKVISNSSWIIGEETVAVDVILHGSRSAAVEGGGRRGRGADNGIARVRGGSR